MRSGSGGRLRLARAVLFALVAASTGCVTVVYGPDPDQGLSDTEPAGSIVNFRTFRRSQIYVELGAGSDLGASGPKTSLSHSAQINLARALDVLAARIDVADLSERTVYLPGLVRHPRVRRERTAFGHSIRGDTGVARRADAAYVTCVLADQVLRAQGKIALEVADADFVLFPVLQFAGGTAVHREYRLYGYPLYLHEEDQRAARLVLYLYDRNRRRLEVLEGERTWQVKIDSYILGIIPVEWVIGF